MLSRAAILAPVLGLAFAQLPPEAVIRSTSRIVNLNVVAVDKHGNAVTDLSKDDFVIKENGKDRLITHFSLEKVDTTKPAPEPAASAGAPPQFTNRVEEKTRAVTIFLFDGLNTRWEDQASAKKELIKYMSEVNATDRVALFALGKNLLLLHGFTTDTQALIDAIKKHASRINNEVADSEPIESNTGNDDLDAFLDAANQKVADYTNTVRVLNTAAALEAIAGYVSRVPGRKNLVWISGGFPITIGFDAPVKIGDTRDRRSFSPEIDRAVRALNNADLAVYPVSAKGLQTRQPGADRPAPKNAGRGGPAFPSAIDTNMDSLDLLAESTGGKAFRDRNDISKAIQTATADSRVSYSLAFSPPLESLDGTYHKLKVEVKRPGVHIRFRKGYFANPDPPQQTLAQAIVSPAAYTGVGLTVTLKSTEKQFVASINVDAHNITLESKDGKWEGQLQFLVVAGKLPADLRAQEVNLHLTPEVYRDVQKGGLVLTAKLPAPEGPFQYHVGVRDVPSGAIGTLHLSKNK